MSVLKKGENKIECTISRGHLFFKSVQDISLYYNAHTSKVEFESRTFGYNTLPLFKLFGVRQIEQRGDALFIVHESGECLFSVLGIDVSSFVGVGKEFLVRWQQHFIPVVSNPTIFAVATEIPDGVVCHVKSDVK
jgi:hypothetical protein